MFELFGAERSSDEIVQQPIHRSYQHRCGKQTELEEDVLPLCYSAVYL